MDILKFNKKTDDGVLSAFADIYSKMKVQNGTVLKLVSILRENGVITDDQVRTICDLTLDQISDPEERERCKRELNDETNDDGRMDSGFHEEFTEYEMLQWKERKEIINDGRCKTV